ncbi:uncharacterized protein IWZ02DRAFT_484647 [Phyllosticta citriasiana]|uniref:uncharacterized protein n=1 Tax=Phyllosticta citriasiana TaxID=595635 RepID=UPI0030FD36B5
MCFCHPSCLSLSPPPPNISLSLSLSFTSFSTSASSAYSQSVSRRLHPSRQKERQTGFPASTNTDPIHHHQPPQQLLSSVPVRQSLPFTARRTWSTFLLWPQPPLSSGHRSRSVWLVSALLWGFLYVCIAVLL